MKVKRQAPLKGKKGYKYLGHFGKASVLRAGHNTWFAALGSAVQSLGEFNAKYAGAKGGQGLVSNLLGGNPNRGRQTSFPEIAQDVKDSVKNFKKTWSEE